MKYIGRFATESSIFFTILCCFLFFIQPDTGADYLIYLRQASVWFPAILGHSILQMMGVHNLSSGAQMILLAVLVWYGYIYMHLPWWCIILLALVLSLLIGAVYGIAKRYVSLSIFTFCMNYVLIGPSNNIYQANRALEHIIAYQENSLFSIWLAWPLAAFGAGLLTWFYLNRTTWGRALPLAIQAKERRLPVEMNFSYIDIIACMVSCCLIGLSGILLALRAGSLVGTSSLGESYALDYTYKIFTAGAIGSYLHPTRKNLIWKAAQGSLGLVCLNAVTQHFKISSMSNYCICGILILITFVMKYFQNKDKKYTF